MSNCRTWEVTEKICVYENNVRLKPSSPPSLKHLTETPYVVFHFDTHLFVLISLINTDLHTSKYPHLYMCVAMSFDLYAKYGNNRTLSLVSPKKPYYQWRLRVPSGHVVRLVILTLHGATPGSCTAHKLSAYDFLLPLQNKIIAR